MFLEYAGNLTNDGTDSYTYDALNRPPRHTRFVVLVIGLALMPLLACASAQRPQPVDPDDLDRQDLSGYQFFEDSFCGITLANKLLQRTSFKSSVLQGVDFSHADLTDADFTDADLRGATFAHATMDGVTLDGAQLRGADFTGVTLPEKWARIMPILTSGDGENADLRNLDLRNVYFYGAYDPIICDGMQARFGALPPLNLRYARFDHTWLEGASIHHSDLRQTNFREANLGGLSITNTLLDDTTFEGVIAHDSWLTNNRFVRANMRHADLTGAKLAGSNLMHADLTDAILTDADLSYVDLTGAQVTPQQLQAVKWLQCAILPDGTINTREKFFGEADCAKYWSTQPRQAPPPSSHP